MGGEYIQPLRTYLSLESGLLVFYIIILNFLVTASVIFQFMTLKTFEVENMELGRHFIIPPIDLHLIFEKSSLKDLSWTNLIFCLFLT